MSVYTTELRFIVESLSSNVVEGYKDTAEAIESARPLIFSFDYPAPEDRKEILETKILKHYYFNEICAETYGQWKMFLDERLNLIMPKYIRMYADIEKLADINLLEDDVHKETETYAGTNTNASTSSTTGSSNSKSKYSDTPQGDITGLESGSYLTNATINEDSSNTSGTVNGNGSDSHNLTRTIEGSRNGKSYYEKIKDYAEQLTDIDTLIINELKDLFMQIY